MDYPQALLCHKGGTGMRYEDRWRLQDEITASANALGYTIWDLRYYRELETFRLELNQHLQDDRESDFCYQMPLTSDYDGEGSHGSMFTLYE